MLQDATILSRDDTQRAPEGVKFFRAPQHACDPGRGHRLRGGSVSRAKAIATLDTERGGGSLDQAAPSVEGREGV